MLHHRLEPWARVGAALNRGKAFAVAILGGMTSAWGAMLAGCCYGIMEALITALCGSAYTQIVTFTLVIMALASRPHGLFGRAGVHKV